MSEMKSLTLNDKKYPGFLDPVARALANASAVIASASGESITLSDSSDSALRKLSIYGKTTQDGVPTLENPVDMVGLENPTVTFNGISISVPHVIHGIPVESGGNYTDVNGQQWVGDEVDIARGVYIKRIGQWVVDGSKTPYSFAAGNNGGLVMGFYYKDVLPGVLPGKRLPKMCDKLQAPWTSTPNSFKDCPVGFWWFNTGELLTADAFFVINVGEFSTVEEALGYLQTNPVTVIGILETPIETPLSPEELATYGTLYSTRPSTTITNNAGAGMSVEYIADTKLYIDRMLATPVRLTQVQLLASAWKGSGNLYSQVISVADVTPYSRVDLLPSVEQMAIFYQKDITFVTENDGGVVTVYVIGQKPVTDYTIQANIVEVRV